MTCKDRREVARRSVPGRGVEPCPRSQGADDPFPGHCGLAVTLPGKIREPDNLVLLHLRRFYAGQQRIERKVDELINRVGNLETSVAGLRREFGHAETVSASLGVRLDGMSGRIERIERRLELAE